MDIQTAAEVPHCYHIFGVKDILCQVWHDDQNAAANLLREGYLLCGLHSNYGEVLWARIFHCSVIFVLIHSVRYSLPFPNEERQQMPVLKT